MAALGVGWEDGVVVMIVGFHIKRKSKDPHWDTAYSVSIEGEEPDAHQQGIKGTDGPSLLLVPNSWHSQAHCLCPWRFHLKIRINSG